MSLLGTNPKTIKYEERQSVPLHDNLSKQRMDEYKCFLLNTTPVKQ